MPTTKKRAKIGKPAPRGRSVDAGESRRKDLIDAAYGLIAERGLEGLRTRDIAARAGVNISTLHYYFGTKDALVVAVIEHVNERFTSDGERLAERVSGGRATLRSHLEAAWYSFHETPHLAAVLQELALRGQRDPTARAAFRAMHKEWNRVVEDVLRAGIERGEIRADLEPRAGARIVTGYLIGAMTQLSLSPRAFDFHAVAAELTRWVARPPGAGA